MCWQLIRVCCSIHADSSAFPARRDPSHLYEITAGGAPEKLKTTICFQAGRQNLRRGSCRHPWGNTSCHLADLGLSKFTLGKLFQNPEGNFKKEKKKKTNTTRIHIPQVKFVYLCFNLEINTTPISKANEETCLNLHRIY